MTADILSIYCPSCGAPAEYDIVHQIYRCSYCRGTVRLERAVEEKSGYRQKIRKRMSQEAGSFPLMTALCSGCGARLVFEENEALTACDFCGRKLVRKKYTETGDMPEGIIPFAVTRAEAEEKLIQWCEDNKRRPEAKHLREKAESLRGYYLPYQMARGPVSCDVNKKHSSKVFTAGGYLQDEFVNCSSQLDNLVLDAMEPYDLTELKEFDYGYVAGQRVKITDISEEEAKKRLKSEVDSNYRVFLEKIWGTKAIDIDSKIRNTFGMQVLLPVYYIREGNVNAAVNGQTGKVSVGAEKQSVYVSLPWWLEAIFIFIAACALVFGIAWMTMGDRKAALLMTGFLAFFYIMIFCGMFEPGLDNTGSITRFRKIFTSGEQTFRREKGRLIPREEILRRKIAEPVFSCNVGGQDVRITYVFRSLPRVLGMAVLAMVGVFLPVILALLINGFDFERLTLGGSAVWFCIAVPVAPVCLIQLGLKELYDNPWVYTVSETGSKKRLFGDDKSGKDRLKGILKVVLTVLLHPLAWVALAVMGVMVYLTAFGF